MSSQKLIHEFKQGDIVHFAGARFETVEDAHESFSHAPHSRHTAATRRYPWRLLKQSA